MERIKLQFMNCQYITSAEKGVVVARVTFKIKKYTFKIKKYTFTTKGVAKCEPSIYDEKIGKRLARARAEKEAYIIARNIINKYHKYLLSILDKVCNSKAFFNSCIDHQKEYINKF